jgi:hypothetical protein
MLTSVHYSWKCALQHGGGRSHIRYTRQYLNACSGPTHRSLQVRWPGCWLQVIPSQSEINAVDNVDPTRLVFDRETGKAKGYGFCEFAGDFTLLLRVSYASIKSDVYCNP